MTKAQAVQHFKAWILPIIIQTQEQDGKKDSGARRQAWHSFKDSLCKDGSITESQYMRWVNPSFC
jgi:hypothetical protein